MKPIQRLDAISSNTHNILKGVTAILSKQKVTHQGDTKLPKNVNEILFSTAMMDTKRFAYVGMNLYKEADTSADLGRIWIKKEIVDPKTGNKEDWLVVYTDDDGELVRQIASQHIQGAQRKAFVEEEGEGKHHIWKCPQCGNQKLSISQPEPEQVSSNGHVCNFVRANEGNPPYGGVEGHPDGGLGPIITSSQVDHAYDSYGEILYEGDSIRNGAGRRGRVISIEDEDVILVNWDDRDYDTPGVSQIPQRLYTGPESHLDIRKLAAEVNPKNIPISPGVKSKNITMDETGGTQNAKVTIDFTDADKGLDFYQNLPSAVDEKKPQEEDATVPNNMNQQPLQPASPVQNKQVLPLQGPSVGGALPAQSSLKPTISTYTQNGMQTAKVLTNSKEFFFINEDGLRVDLPWQGRIRLGSQFERPDTGAIVRLSGYVEIGFEGDDEIVEELVEMMVDKVQNTKLDNTNPLEGGIGDGTDINELDPEQVGKGYEVEGEHSKDEGIVGDIIKDHLTEDPKYYDKLEKMEKDKKESQLTLRGIPPGGDGNVHSSSLGIDSIADVRDRAIEITDPDDVSMLSESDLMELLANPVEYDLNDSEQHNIQLALTQMQTTPFRGNSENIFDVGDSNDFGSPITSGRRFSADISDNVPPMGWQTQSENNNIPSGAGPVLNPQPNLQDNPGVLYDSNKDSGPKFQTTINPGDKSVTVKFLNSDEKNQLDQALNQTQPNLIPTPQQPVAPLNSQQRPAEFEDQQIPINY